MEWSINALLKQVRNLREKKNYQNESEEAREFIEPSPREIGIQ